MYLEMYLATANRGNPGAAGLGIVMVSGDSKPRAKERAQFLATGNTVSLDGFNAMSTSSRTEAEALSVALNHFIDTLLPKKEEKVEIVIKTESRYIHDAFDRGLLANWVENQYKRIKNADLWEEIGTAVGIVESSGGRVSTDRVDKAFKSDAMESARSLANQAIIDQIGAKSKKPREAKKETKAAAEATADTMPENSAIKRNNPKQKSAKRSKKAPQKEESADVTDDAPKSPSRRTIKRKNAQ